jgi:hypothetical protein
VEEFAKKPPQTVPSHPQHLTREYEPAQLKCGLAARGGSSKILSKNDVDSGGTGRQKN